VENSRGGRAPFVLSAVGWLTILSGIVQVVAGILLLAFRDDVLDEIDQYTSGELSWFGVAAIVIGLIYIMVGRGFLHLNAFALTLGFVLSSLAIIGDVIFLGSNDANHAGIVVSLVLNVIVFLAGIAGFSARSATR
jgi:hypothetical protein